MNLYQLRYFSLLAKTGHFENRRTIVHYPAKPESFYLLIRTRIGGHFI